jgi:hypothetical protein
VTERFEVSVTFDERRGYVATALDLRRSFYRRLLGEILSPARRRS